MDGFLMNIACPEKMSQGSNFFRIIVQEVGSWNQRTYQELDYRELGAWMNDFLVNA